jgi:phenylalanyl-tRNA synthetase alpha subunit
LKIMSMNHYDLEENSRMELLVEFKVSYGNAMKTIMAMLEKFRKDMDFEKRQEFVYSFFPFMFGIYPYTVVTKKQKEAMKLAGVDYTYSSLYNLTFVAVRRMLRN